MKFHLSMKHLLLELLLANGVAGTLSLFAQNFLFWLAIILILLLIWHHYIESTLLKILNPNKVETKHKKISPLEHLSQTAAYHQENSRRERVQTQRFLSKLKRNIQFLPDAIIVCKSNGDISWCNQSAQQLFSFFWDKKANKNIFSVIFYPEFRHHFQQQDYQSPLIVLTNNKRYIELHLNSDDSQSLFVIARDVTSFIRLLHSRQTFLANINHELRTPITVLQGYLEMLENDINNPILQQKALSAMKSQSHRMMGLLEQLSILAKIESSTNAEHKKVNVSQLVLSLQKNTELLRQKQQIIFTVEPDIYVIGDEGQLQSAISNLIYNSIRHAGEEATIQIRWEKNEQGAIFSVCDNGVGIAPHHLMHLTERFYRVDESRSNKTGGSGLGLAIVKHALEQHHSYLEIYSEVGKGSQFSFLIKAEYLTVEPDDIVF